MLREKLMPNRIAQGRQEVLSFQGTDTDASDSSALYSSPPYHTQEGTTPGTPRPCLLPSPARLSSERGEGEAPA